MLEKKEFKNTKNGKVAITVIHQARFSPNQSCYLLHDLLAEESFVCIRAVVFKMTAGKLYPEPRMNQFKIICNENTAVLGVILVTVIERSECSSEAGKFKSLKLDLCL